MPVGTTMPSHSLHTTRILLLALAAIALGSAFAHADSAGRGASIAAARSEAASGVQPTAPGELVAAPSNVRSGAPAAPDAAAPPAPSAPADAPVSDPAATPVTIQRRGGVACSTAHQTVQVRRDAAMRARPEGRVLGTLPASSAYLGQPMTAWVQQLSADGRWAKVTVPWSKPVDQAGWVDISGLRRGATRTMVVADLSDRMLRVYRGCAELFAVRTAIGRPGSPSPQGRFWVTDRVAVPAAQQDSFGTYAFGLSSVQPNLPTGWTGGDQMAIHGTGAPGSIGEAASAGCLRVDEAALARLKPMLAAGTPVVIQA